MKNRRYPSLKPVGNSVKKFTEHARAWHVSVFRNMPCPCVSYKKNTAFPSSFSWKCKGNLQFFIVQLKKAIVSVTSSVHGVFSAGTS